MNLIDESISKFMSGQTCATVAGIDAAGKPACFNCFFALDEINGWLIFKSNSNTKHSHWLRLNPIVTGSVLPDTLNVLSIQGVQWMGQAILADSAAMRHAWKLYHQKHPAALLMAGSIWIIELETVNMSAGTGAFCKKTKWSRSLPEMI